MLTSVRHLSMLFKPSWLPRLALMNPLETRRLLPLVARAAVALSVLAAVVSVMPCKAADRSAHHRRAHHLPAALLRAERALAAKSSDAAALFEHASHVEGESATAEVGMVRAYMASGQYRRALSFAHLVQGEHTKSSEALAWVAFLNDRSGQTGIALRMLESARAAQPDDVALLCAQSEILIDRQQAARAIGELDAWLARNAPQPLPLALRYRASLASDDAPSQSTWRLIGSSSALPAALATRDAETKGTWIAPYFDALPEALSTASGMHFDEGTRVITALPVLRDPAASILVRDAQGHVRSAVVETRFEDVGMAILKLERPLPHTSEAMPEIAGKIFPGSPFHVVGFPLANNTQPVFPTNTTGFFPRASADLTQYLSLGEQLSAGLAGAAVFTANGQLAGFVGPDARSGILLPAATLMARLGKRATNTAGPRLSNEEIYERALNRVVLVATARAR